MSRGLLRFSILTGIVIATTSASTLVFAYTSGTYGSGTYGACSYGNVCSITLSSNGSISLDITPASGGRCTIHSDTASVLTDDSNGYTLTLADNGTNTSLVNGGATIDATSATIASPAAISGNHWGYRVDGLGSFGSGPTTSQSNVSPDSTLFAGIKASNQTADTLAATSTAANPAVTTTVWYGACADTSVASGAYTTQVTYTAVAN
jgi:hypothetical protein